MKNIYLLRIWVLISVLILTFSQAWGDTYTLGWGSATGTNCTNFTTTSGTVTGIVSFSTAKNSASSNPAYNSSSKELRLYYNSGGNGGSITLTPATGVTITGFTITTSTSPTTKYKVGSGSLTAITLSNNSGSVTGLSVGSTSSITIQNCNTSNTQLRIKTITITYSTASSCTNPTISSQPTGATYTQGASATALSVTANGTSLTYQWYSNTSSSTTGASSISGATSSTYTPSTASAGTTYYYCVVSSGSCSTTSNIVSVTVNVPTHKAYFYNGSTLLNTGGTSFAEGAAVSYSGSDPTSCDSGTGASTTFVGWATDTWTGKVAKASIVPTFYDISAGGSLPNMNTSDVTYYAVFAKSDGSGSFDGTNGGTFKIYADVSGTKYYASGTGSKISSTTTESSATEYTITAVTGGFTIQSGTTYITYSSSTNLGTSTTAYTWTFTSGTKGTWRANSAKSGRGFIFRAGTTNQFGGYSTSNVTSSGTEYYDLEIGGSASYSNYMTTCCSPLGAINGSVNFTNPTEAVLTWNNMSNVAASNPYTVTYKTHSGSTYGSTGVGSITTDSGTGKKTCTITGLSCNTDYDFKIEVTAATNYCDKSETLENKNSGMWTVGYTLTNVTKSSGPDAGANVCGDFSAVFAATSPKILPAAITVTIGGTEKTAGTDYTWNQSTGTLTIASAKITGAIAVTITGATSSGYCISAFNSSNNGLTSGFSNGGSGSHYTLSYTIPGKDGSSNWPQYWVGENEAWASAFSANATFADMPLTSNNSATLGLAEGATGTLHIWDDNITSGSNLYIKFEPSGYGLRWGGSGDWNQTANTEAFTVDPNNSNVYWTDLVTLDGTNNTAWNYYVGLQTETGYVYSGVDDEANDTRGISRTRAVTAMKVSNGTSGSFKATYLNSEPTGSRGKFRIWNNNISDYNFVCHWVPYYQLRYNANGGSGTMASLPASPVSCEESAANRTVTVGSCTFTAPTGKEFKEWNTQADGNGTTVSTGSRVLTSDETLYAIWKNKTYSISATMTNVSCSALNSADSYTYTGSAANVSYKFTANPGYALPSSVTVTGTTSTWNQTTGVLTLTGTITSDVSISISGVVADTYIDFLHGDENDTQVLTGSYTVPTFATAATGSTCEGKHKYFMGFSNSENSTTVVKEAGASATADGTTYYAVWAEGSSGTSATVTFNTANSDGTADINASIADQVSSASGMSSYSGSKVYVGSYGLKLGASGSAGSITCTLSTAITTKTITIDAKQYGSDSGTLSVTVNSNTSFGSAQSPSSSGGVLTFTVNDAIAVSSVTVATSAKRAYVKTITVGEAQTYSDYKTSCCADPAEVTLTPSSQTIYKDIDGDAETTIAFSQTGGTESGGVPVGTFGDPSVSSGATVEKSGSNINFSSTTSGTYTVTIGFTETCEKTGSATVTVAEQGIINTTASGSAVASLSFSPLCGQNTASTDITVDSRYLSGSSITASIATSTGTGHFEISDDNSTFGTSNLTLSGGTSTKVTDHIYVRYASANDETGSVAGTLTLTAGTTTKTITLTGTVNCSANIRIEGDPVQIVATKGVWVEASSVLTLTGSYLTTNSGPNSNVSIRAYTDNAHFQIKTGDTAGEGAAKTSAISSGSLSLVTNHSSATWTGTIGVVYKPVAYNTTETATLTVEVFKAGGSTVYYTATYSLNGRSLPENFVIAVNDGTLADGHWYAVPADMIAPWGSGCSALGTYAPYAITVDNPTGVPTIASNVPSRAVYTAVARTGATNTNPQTMSYKSVPLSAGGTNHYLYGSSTDIDSDGSNTSIQNATNASSEKQKWFIDVVDWDNKKYNMRIASNLNTYKLAYNATSNIRRVGLYSDAAINKKDIYILPISGTTCTYYAAPDVTCYATDATNYTVRFARDRISTYEVKVGSGSWTTLTTREITDCTGEEAKRLEADLPWATYRGQTVQIRAKVASGGCQEIGSSVVPDPSITVKSGTWTSLTGVAGYAFSDATNGITISGLASCGDGASVEVSGTDADKITAELNSTTGVVTIGMTAANAVAGTYNATLTFTAPGATTRTQNITITIYSYAPITVSSPVVNNMGYYCKNSATDSYLYIDAGSDKLYDENGNVITSSNWGSYFHNYLIDVTAGDSVTLTRNAITDNKLTLNLPNNGYRIIGHTYRFYFNIDRTGHVKTVYNEDGVPYMPKVFEFTVVDCSKPTALPACPITSTGFTANWFAPSCSGTTTVNIYQKSESEILNTNFIEYGLYKAWSYAYNDKYYDVWVYGGSGTVHGDAVTSTHASGQYIARSSKTCEWFSPKLSTLSSSIDANTDLAVEVTVYHSNNNGNNQTLKVIVIDNPSYSNDAVPTTGNSVYFNGIQGTVWTSESISASGESKTFKISIKGATGNSRIGFFGTSKINTTYLRSVKISTATKSNQTSVTQTSCSSSYKAVTGLTAGTEYYYTVTNNGQTSDEQRVTTRSAAPSITYFPARIDMQTDVNGTVTQKVTFSGKNLTPCDLDDILGANTKTGSSYFSIEMGNNCKYNAQSGDLSGSFTVTYHPTATGEHTGTYKVGNVGTALPLNGHACESGFGTMANNGASPKTAYTATISWNLSTTGTVMLAQGTRLNTELLSNGDFELGLAGWDEDVSIPGQISTVNRTTGGSKSRYCTHQSTADLMVNGSRSYEGVYTEQMTFLPGTYHLEGYVRHAASSTTTGAFNAAYNNFYIGICKDSTDASYLKHVSVAANADYAFQFNNDADAWKKIYVDFTLTEKVVGRVFVARTNSAANQAYFFVDDVSLKMTAGGALNDKTMFTEAAEVTNASSVNLTGLKPLTNYSFYVIGSDGCESNVATFTTESSSDPISITATPSPVTISGPLGKTVSTTVNVTTVNAYAQVVVGTGTCTDGRIKVSPSSLSPDGGIITVSFTPLSTDEMGDSGSCQLILSTTGASEPENVTVNWSITSGFDPSTPVVEVVDISNTDMSIEHNVTQDAENTTVKIILNREKSADEIDENVGDEIFFSKYYEADKNVKLLAIFNPTHDTISLAGTYIWLSRDAEYYWGHNDDNKLALGSYGKHKRGYIAPSEEIIFYRYESNVSDDAKTIACAMEKVDMSDWNRVYSGVLSFSGNDAFVLVRDTTINDRIPPEMSCDGETSLSWQYIGAAQGDTASLVHKYAMLDIMGARTETGWPSNANLAGTWSWTNCKASNAAESGDASGWYGFGQDLTHESYSYYNCSSQNGKAGYKLSTFRCLLIRLINVKSGSNAVQQNIGDFYTLDWEHSLEWQGAHVPQDADDEKEVQISCENFSFIGGYDYAGYYNKWTPLDEEDYIEGDLQPDGSWNIHLNKGTPHYYCHNLRIQVAEVSIVNGVEVENVHASETYKVPIVVDGPNENTTDTRFRGGSDTQTEDHNTLTELMCDSCDVVIRGGAKLTHNNNSGQSQFRNIQVYAGGKLMVTSGLNMDLDGIQVRSTNDEVGYAIINNADASITIDTIEHVKRIDDMYWYPFSLPYDCKVSHIRQLNGKTMGEYGDMAGNGDWMIQKYDGYNRQLNSTSASAGQDGQWWVRVEPNETLKAHQAYIIGLYTAEEVSDDEGNTYRKMKYVYFPPLSQPGYTENGTDTKTANVTAWKDGSTAEADRRHHGWNFVGLPYLSVFDPNDIAEANAGVNNSSVMIMGKIITNGAYIDTENVYVSIPDGGNSRTYTQVTAKNQKLEPFKGYFIQVADGSTAGSAGETKTIAYSKNGRTLTPPSAPHRANNTGNAKAMIELAMTEVTESTEVEPLTDNAGLLVSDDYSLDYEIGLDLTKMYAAAAKPQLFSYAETDNQKLAYNAMPVDNALNIPLGIYAPKKGIYTLSIKEKQSQLDNVTAVWLLHNGVQVKNLLFGDFQLDMPKKGLNNEYSIGVDMVHRVPTIISETDGTDNITVSQQDGRLFVDGLEDGATVTLYDMVGRQMSSAKASGGYAELAVPVAGSYNIVVRTDKSVKTIKTVVR
ncbi:MAG: InlB B-repeat-containing protein [Paludibacteraceae bacterium]|nr:InlB B-repeat-containing protein [Paludibacteraceae bacterium]